jgi:hypothetical protein
MRKSARAAASCVILLTAAFPPGLRAADAILEIDSKFPPPALCLQQLLGLHDHVGRMGASEGGRPGPPTLDAIDGRRSAAEEAGDDSATAWALRARRLKPVASPAEWSRLESAWGRYAALRAKAGTAMERVCTGEQIAQSAGTDMGYVILGPFEALGAFFPDVNGNATPSVLFLPVVGAVGLVTAPVFAAALPVAKARQKLRMRRAAAAFERFKALVAGLERSGGASR